MLHNDPQIFEQVILRTSDKTKIEAGIIEKDYYVTLALKEISKRVPNIIFKGGTSLSKCYKLIERFSEDIDLTMEFETKPTEGQRRNLKRNIVSIIDDFGFELANAEHIRSRRDFNKYVIDYPSVFRNSGLKQHLQIETMVKIRAYPNRTMKAASLIHDFLLEEGYHDLIAEYELMPFELKVQAAERTFIDKIFALMDYYLSGKIIEHSRHIYDLHKLLDIVRIDDELKALFQDVRLERKAHPKICLSAQDDADIRKLLTEIISKEVYKADYMGITELLLFEKVEYDEAIKSVKAIVDSGLL